ncbi:MAG: Mor transcription activator family protein [Hydrogenoanaerobacterium sp.]
MNLHEKLTLEDLPPKQREIAEIVGLDKYILLTKRFGGDTPYIQKYSELIKSPRNDEIKEKFNGYNATVLALEYNLSERYIRELVCDIRREVQARPIDGQLFFEQNF